MIDFNALLNAAFEAAIEAKVAPLRAQIEKLVADGLDTHIVRVNSESELSFVPDIQALVDARVQHGIDAHQEEYDHDEFISEDDLKSKIVDKIDDVFESKFEAALDGTRVTLNT